MLFGFPMIFLPKTRKVSAPITIAFLNLTATTSAFPREICIASLSGESFCNMSSRKFEGTALNLMPVSAKIFLFCGEEDASITFIQIL